MPNRNQNTELFEFGAFRLNVAERVLTKDRQAVPLTPKAFDTLVVLLRNSGHVVEKDALLKEIWRDTFVEEGVLAVNVAAIRKALSDGEQGRSYLETVPRRGYRFVGELRTASTSPESELLIEVEQHNKSWARLGAVGAGVAVLLAVGVGLYLSRWRPRSTDLSFQPIPLTSYPGAELSPTFSPDSSQVAFSWNGPQQENFDIYVKLVDRGDPVRLTQNPDPDTSAAWSPDGGQIAFIRRGSILLVSPLGGHERRLADAQATHVAWTPDSKSLAVSSGSDGKYQILLMSAETGEARPLVSSPAQGFSFGDIGSAVSPDGLRLAFARFSTSTTADLFLMPMTGGEPRRLTENGAPIWGFGWTPDGKELVYSSGQFNTAATLSRRRLETPADVRSEQIKGVEEGSVEPVIAGRMQGRGSRLAYERTILDTNIWAMETFSPSGRGNRIIASTRRDADPQFSLDGRRLAFGSDRSGIRQIWVSDSDGSNQMQLTSFSSGFANAPRWSPDGQRIVFAAIVNNNRDIYVVSVEGGAPRRLTSDPSEEGRPSWSRDGRWIYFYSSRSGHPEIWKMPAEGGNAVQVTTEGGHESFESPDGKLLYYQVGYSGLRAISTGEVGPKMGQVFLPALWPGWWAVSDRGVYFIEFNETGASPFRVGGPFLFSVWAAGLLKVSHPIEFYDFKTQQVTKLGLIEKELVRALPGFSVTSDGQRIAWSQIDHAESDLMMIENFR